MLTYITFLSTKFTTKVRENKQTLKQTKSLKGLRNDLVGKGMLCTHEYLSLDSQHIGEKLERFVNASNVKGWLCANAGSSLCSSLNREFTVHLECLS